MTFLKKYQELDLYVLYVCKIHYAARHKQVGLADGQNIVVNVWRGMNVYIYRTFTLHFKEKVIINFSYNNQNFIYSPNDTPVSCLKNNIKIYIETAPTCFGVTVTPSVQHIDTNKYLIYAATPPPY